LQSEIYKRVGVKLCRVSFSADHCAGSRDLTITVPGYYVP